MAIWKVGHQFRIPWLEKVLEAPSLQVLKMPKQLECGNYIIFLATEKEGPQNLLAVGVQLRGSNVIHPQNLYYEVRERKF